MQEGPAARATGPFSRTERRPYGLVGSEVAGAVDSVPAGLWCFLAFFSGLAADVDGSVLDGSGAVAELGVPLLEALSAWGSGGVVAAGSVP